MKEKKTHGVQLLIRCVVRDPDGKVITDTGQKPSKSFVIQFLEFVSAMFNKVTVIYDATATNGAENRLYHSGQTANFQIRVDAPINISVYGVVVGTGDTAETNADFALDVQLTEGVGVGNITHNAVVIDAAAVVGANVDLEIKRSFINNTGAAITVEEAGIYVRYSAPGGPWYHCIIRDVLGASVEIPDKCSLAVYYTVRTTV